jgi:indole-3-glycerol phosphate synthase
MSILDRIIADKKKEVAFRKKIIPLSYWEQSPLFERPTLSLVQKLTECPSGIIAEHKRRSPSRENINSSLSLTNVALGYEKAGACGLSVLTDQKYFGGSLEDLTLARASVALPILRKEFIVDSYQLFEAKAHGADVVLLIAAVLCRDQIQTLSQTAKALGLEVLLEVHNRKELDQSLMPSLDLLGVNNRNLKSFEVSLDTSRQLAEHIPDAFVKVSESGIRTVQDIQQLQSHGFKGFLIGENFMKTEDPGAAAANFIKTLTP